MKVKKINLSEFKAASLKVSQLLAVKGGSGSTGTQNCSTNTACGCDKDSETCDSD